MPSLYQKKENGLVISVRVKPKSKADKLLGQFNNQLKISLKAPPVDGKANLACRVFLAKLFSVPQSDVEYLQGETQRSKVILIYGDPNKLESCLNKKLEETNV